MSEFLKLTQFSEHNGVPEVNIRGRRIDAEPRVVVADLRAKGTQV